MTARHPEHGTLWQAAADPQIYEEEDYYEISEGEKKGPEAMFEKPLTPSDVSKLNRLVIPKQYAERYFPLDLESNERGGLTLSFEDEAGKMWRFRYSYWTSSQSYVLTKGWSRYVKEKQLEAGDIVSFLQGQRLHHIRWRRQESSPEVAALPLPPALMPLASWGTNFYHPGGAPMFVGARQHQDILLHTGQEMVDSSAAVNSKRVRLFGVNLD